VRFDVDVTDAYPRRAKENGGLELGAVVCLDDLDVERKPLPHLVHEMDGLQLLAGKGMLIMVVA
jgi:hypothetical protein